MAQGNAQYLGKYANSNAIVKQLYPVSKSLAKNWRKLAQQLEMDGAEVMRLSQSLLLDKLGIIDVVQELIDDWKMRKADDATLTKLIEHLKAAELEDAAAILKSEPDYNLC